MVDFLYNLYSLFCNDAYFLEKIKLNSVFRKIIRFLSNMIIPVWYKLTANNPQYVISPTIKTEGRIIASLTTFPARVNKLWIVIESIMRQKKKPDMLFLWLSKEQFSTIEDLPIELRNLQNRGLQIEFCDGDLRSHKKYYYVLSYYPKDHLFTLDDDIIYPSNTLSSVWNVSEIFPECVIGRYSNHIKIDKNGNVCFDRNYCKPFILQPSWNTFIGSGGGTLFKAGMLPQITTDKETFMSICKTADDIWLNTMCRFSGHQVVAIMKKCPLLEIIHINNFTLTSINYGAENYKQQKAVRDFCIANGIDPFQSLEENMCK